MSGPYSQEQYERAKKAVVSGGVPPDKVPIVQQRITQYEDDRARGYLPAPEAKPPTSESLSHKTPALDMGNSSVIDYLGTVADKGESEKQLAISKVRAATEDDSLPTASKLKALNAPPEWQPKKVANPFSALPAPDKDTQYFYEPSLEQFQEAISTGALAKQLEREFPGQKGEIDPKWLADSKSFRAYKDAAWKHALAEAMRSNTPIVRAEFSKNIGTLEKLQAKALDPVVAGASGALSGMSMGLADPLIRAVAPETAEAERRSRMRNPTADFAGQLIGGLSPTGLPSLVAKGATKALGAVGLGNKGLSGLAKSTAAGAATGAAEANIRAIAQSAADALDAGESAIEAVQRIYDTLASQQTIDRSFEGGGLGVVFGAGGHLIGSATNTGARSIVGADERLPTLVSGQDSGIRMSPIGNPVKTPDMEAAMARGISKGANADELLANEAIPVMADQRLAEQMAAVKRGEQETVAARERLASPLVPTKPMADEILKLAASIPEITPEAIAKVKNLEVLARELKNNSSLTAAELDARIQRLAKQAKHETGKPDEDWKAAESILMKGRDQLEDPTSVDNYVLHDKRGDSRVASGYGAMKTRHATEMAEQTTKNMNMGLPARLKPEPQRLGNKSEAETGQFLESHRNFQQVQRYFNDYRAVASDVERSDFSRPKSTNRTTEATQAQYATNEALREAVASGYGYQGKTFRGARMTHEQIQSMVGSGRVKTDSIWSTSKDMEHALSFAKKGNRGEPVLFEVDGSSGVSLDQVPGLNTFDEVVVPTGKTFKIADSYRGEDGVLRVKISDGARAPDGDELSALAEGKRPKAALDANEHQAFQSKILGIADTKNAIAADEIQKLAARSGIPEKMTLIKSLRNQQNWKNLLGRSVANLARGDGGMASFIEAQSLRAVPALKSLSGGLDNPGGLPKMEASPQAEALVDKFLAQAVPEARVANLRGGQAARPGGAYGSRDDEKKLRDDMTDEEAQFALKVIKSILATEGQKLQRAQ